MTTDKLLQLIEHFVGNYAPVYTEEPLQLDKAFLAGESLALPTPAVFRHDINMAGYVLRVCGDTVFRENLIDATVLALGNIVIEGESRNCRIFSMDSISVGRSEESVFMCYGDFAIGAEASNSSTTTIGAIRGEKASVCGGNFSAGGSIVVHSAYDPGDGGQTAFSVGDRRMYLATLRILHNYVRKLRDDLLDIEDVIRSHGFRATRQLAGGIIAPQFEQLREQHTLLREEVEKKRLMLDGIRKRAAEPERTRNTITVLAYTSSNVSINIGGRLMVTRDDMQSVEFRAENNHVATGPARPRPTDEENVTFIEL